MTRDLTPSESLFAESMKYSNLCLILIPLPSGAFAYAGNDRRIRGALDDENGAIAEACAHAHRLLEERKEVKREAKSSKWLDIDLEIDL
jgi:hypothetical protein